MWYACVDVVAIFHGWDWCWCGQFVKLEGYKNKHTRFKKYIKKECSLRGFCLVGARAIVHILGIGEIIMLLQIKHIIQVTFNAGTERSVWLWRCIVVII